MATRLKADMAGNISGCLCALLAAGALAGCSDVITHEEDYLSARDEVDALRASVESDLDSVLRAAQDLSDAIDADNANQIVSAGRRFERAFEDLLDTWERYNGAWQRLESAGAVYSERWNDYEGVLLREVDSKLRDRVEDTIDVGEDLNRLAQGRRRPMRTAKEPTRMIRRRIGESGMNRDQTSIRPDVIPAQAGIQSRTEGVRRFLLAGA